MTKRIQMKLERQISCNMYTDNKVLCICKEEYVKEEFTAYHAMKNLKHGVDMTETALTWLRSLPRVSLENIRNDPGREIKHERGHGRYGGKLHGIAHKGAKQRQRYSRPGFEGGTTPFYLRIPKEGYYAGHHLKRQYLPLSLFKLQKFIDTDRIDTSGLIDLSSLCKTGLFDFNPQERHFGVQLTDTGINKFSSKIDIEVQYAPEHVIAAIEKLGGSITLAYYDVHSLYAIKNPKLFFEKGEPIPKRLLPPEDAIELYTNPKMRGYLADPQQVEYERGVLAQKYGYELIVRDPPVRKDPLQIFLGLHPGWVVNLKDKVILKPKDPELLKYYNSLHPYEKSEDLSKENEECKTSS